MSARASVGRIAGGLAFMLRHDCIASRPIGAGIAAAGALLVPSPATADQNLMVADNGEVRCEASRSDLTRISLKDDQFASVSKVSTGIPSEDFSVVNEPVRGDIYLSVPDGYAKPAISFFGTTRKGFVYKFVCSIAGEDARQVFIANADLERPPEAAGASIPAALSDNEGAVRLIQAMYVGSIVDGFEIRDRALTPVNVGELRVQLLSEYRGVALTGKSLRIENRGEEAVTISEAMIAPSGVLAVSIAEPELAPGGVTTAFVVARAGELE